MCILISQVVGDVNFNLCEKKKKNKIVLNNFFNFLFYI